MTNEATEAITRIFYIFDKDKDNALSDHELKEYQVFFHKFYFSIFFIIGKMFWKNAICKLLFNIFIKNLLIFRMKM